MLQSSPPASGISLAFIEGVLTLMAMGIAFAFPRLGNRWFTQIERKLGKLARRKNLAVFVTGAAALVGRLALLPSFPIPLPFVPDDFSFLLAADTFAHGRLTNPTPPMWVHFESIQIDMLPTYMSMYFPGPGLIMAAGKILFGHPWYGLLIVNALMCAAICWMLQAWLPPTWALLGGALAVVRLALFSYWINTYHGGGALAALGGALVLGSLPRLRRKVRLRHVFALTIGIVTLAYTRPYEGVLLCVAVAYFIFSWLFRSENRPPPRRLLAVTAIATATLVTGVVWLGYYNYRVFGSPFTLPYAINRATYAVAPYYIWQHLRPEPPYRHAEIRRFYQNVEMNAFKPVQTFSGYVELTAAKNLDGLLFYAGFLLLPPLLTLHRVLLDRRTRFLVFSLCVLFVGMSIEIFFTPHYWAAFAAAIYAIGLQAMRHLRQWKPEGRETGKAMVRLITAACFVLAAVRVADRPLRLAPREWPVFEWTEFWYGPDHFGTERAAVKNSLEKMPGKQLAVVRYSSTHETQDEWVYNPADIENAKVIWAREMDARNNRELLRYYHDRRAWLVQPDLPMEQALSQYSATER